MKKDIDLLITNAGQLLTMVGPSPSPTGDIDLDALGALEGGAVAIDNEKIVALGRSHELETRYTPKRRLDAHGRLVTPGLVDPHTHVVFAGGRHREFGMRMRGATYHEILEAGGGIHSTVRATRKASRDELAAGALPRLKALLSFGVTTAEVKSGYALQTEGELKMLETAQMLSKMQPIRLSPTYLGAHVIPLEHRESRDVYVRQIIEEDLPEVASRGLATACDVFLDRGAYTASEARAVLTRATELGLQIKIHAGQFTDLGGPQLVAELGGLSADHLEVVSDEGVAAMAEAGVVATFLPGAAFSLRDHFPDGQRYIEAKVRVAVATDDNPGTSRTENLPLMAAMAVTRMGLTCHDAWKAVTINAAAALGLGDEIGSLEPGKAADLVIWSCEDCRQPLYHFGMNHVETVVAAGRIAHEVNPE